MTTQALAQNGDTGRATVRASSTSVVGGGAGRGVSRSTGSDGDAAVRRVKRVAHWLDSRFRVPGTGIRFGLDTLVGLVPVVGDTATAVVGLYPIVEARRLGVGKWTLARMVGNVGLDWAIGLVPGADVVLDTWFKSHVRNAALLEEAVAGRSGLAGPGERAAERGAGG